MTSPAPDPTPGSDTVAAEAFAELARAVEGLSKRLAAVEYRLGVPSEASAARPAPQDARRLVNEMIRPRTGAQGGAPLREGERQSAGESERAVRPLPPPAAPPVAPVAAAVVPWVSLEKQAPAATTPIRDRGAESWGVEKLIGGRVYAAIGALVVVVGVGLFLKLAVERGWLRLPPEWRCGAAAVFGVALMGAGEWARRKINAAASMGLTGAGVAVLYGAAYAAHGLYHLYGPGAAFGILAAVSVLGVTVAVRAGLVSVAVLSMVGAYVTPLVIHEAEPSPVVLPVYLLALLGLGLWLSGARPAPFRAVRIVAWWGTVILGTLWAFGTGLREPWMAAAFLALVWGAVHGELWWSGRVDRASRGFAALAIMSFATTAWSVGVAVLVFRWTRVELAPPDWFAPAAGAVAALCVAVLLAGNLRVLRDAPETDRERLGAGLLTQAGGLVVAAVALGLTDWAELLAWLGLGVAAAAASRWIGARALGAYGLVLLTIGAGRLLLWDSWHAGGGVRMAAGLALTRFTALAGAAGASWLGAAALLRPGAAEHDSIGRRWRRVSDACVGIGLTLPWCGVVAEESAALSVTLLGVGLGVAVLATGVVLRSVGLMGYAAAVLASASCAAVGFQFGRPGAASYANRFGEIVVTGWGWTMLLLSVVWFGVAETLRRRDREVVHAGAPALAAFAGAVMLFVSITGRGSDAGWVCVAWGLFATAIVFAHRWRPTLGLDGLGMAGMGASVGAWAVRHPLGDWMRSGAPVGLHPGLWTAVAIVLLSWAGLRWLRSGAVESSARLAHAGVAAGAVGAALLLAATSFEVARAGRVLVPSDSTAQQAALSVWWGLFASAWIVIGFVRRVPVLRQAGLGLLGVATCKAVVFDLAEVAPEWRVVSFLGLGLLMLGVAVVYARVSARLEAPRAAA